MECQGATVSFEFRRQGIVWLEDTNQSPSVYYKLHTTRDVSFSQTFAQQDVTKKTVHDPTDIINGSSITQANPANFSFTIFMVDEPAKHQHKPLDMLVDFDNENTSEILNKFNLYFVYEDYSPEVYYKIEDCFMRSGSWNLPRSGIVTVSLSGEGAKLTRNTGTFPGAANSSPFYQSNPSIMIANPFEVYVGGQTASDQLDNVVSASFEIQNNVTWTPNNTLQNSLAVTDSTNTIYPSKWSMGTRSFAGSITQYVDETNALSKDNINTWAENTTVLLKIGRRSNSAYNLEIRCIDNASFTNRVGFGEVFTQSYDFRLMDNDFGLVLNILDYV